MKQILLRFLPHQCDGGQGGRERNIDLLRSGLVAEIVVAQTGHLVSLLVRAQLDAPAREVVAGETSRLVAKAPV